MIMDLRCSIDSFIYVFDLSQCTISNPDDKSSEIAVIEGGIVKLGDNPVWSNATLRLNGATSEIDYGGDVFTVGSNGTVRIDKYWLADNNMIVANGGRLSHTPNTATEYRQTPMWW